MSAPGLTLCRILSRLDFRPKSILYYYNRAKFASRYFPRLYSDWGVQPAELRLTDKGTERRMTMTSGSIGFEVDGGLDHPQSVIEHISAVTRAYMDETMAESKPIRLGIEMIFMTEGASFEELFPLLKRHSVGQKPWCEVDRYPIRDLGFNVFYGTQKKGLNAEIGVLNPEQAVAFRDKLSFERTRKFANIDEGTLMIRLDQFVTEVGDSKAVKGFFSRSDSLSKIAHDLADPILKGFTK